MKANDPYFPGFRMLVSVMVDDLRNTEFERDQLRAWQNQADGGDTQKGFDMTVIHCLNRWIACDDNFR